jgi:hypothetical protein
MIELWMITAFLGACSILLQIYHLYDQWKDSQKAEDERYY